MRKKSTARRSLASKPETQASPVTPLKDHRKDLFFYARSFHLAAQKLAGTLEFGFHPFADFDVSPVVLLYRNALELILKTIILGEGGNFLPMKPDAISVSKTHSLSWLAQFVRQIVTALGWEEQFKCEGIQTFGDFKILLATMNSVDPGAYVFRSPVDPRSQVAVQDFTRKMEAVLELLERTADGLAAEWLLRSEPESGNPWRGGGLGPTIH